MFAAHQEAGQTCIQVFFFRTGNNWGNRAYFPRADKSLAVEEVLESFIAQFYDDKPPPKLILLSHDIATRRLLAEALSLRAGHKIAVTQPVRGEKRELVEHALINAREALARRLAEIVLAGGDPGAARRAARSRRGAASGSRSTTTATSRAPTRSAR